MADLVRGEQGQDKMGCEEAEIRGGIRGMKLVLKPNRGAEDMVF